MLLFACWLRPDTCQSKFDIYIFLKQALSINKWQNQIFSFKKKKSTTLFYLPFSSWSLSSRCLRASSFIIRATGWEAIREKLTQLPAGLSRLQPHQASPSPPVWQGWPPITFGRGLSQCKIFIRAPLVPWELCTKTLVYSQVHYMLERKRQRQLNVDHWCRWWQMGSFLISGHYAVMPCFLGCVMKIKHRNCIDFYWNLKKKTNLD